GGFRIAALLVVVLVLLVLAVLAVFLRVLLVLAVFLRRGFRAVGRLLVVTGGLLRCVGRFFVGVVAAAVVRIAFLDHGDHRPFGHLVALGHFHVLHRARERRRHFQRRLVRLQRDQTLIFFDS